jgi:hypothetical protein
MQDDAADEIKEAAAPKPTEEQQWSFEWNC